ncbi:putative WD repeat-containing protein 43-like [Capsicum annuum]|uniref:NB-ARC domain-containing protein n=1 Tax=Capsicum annuum TaxID=4072 RepID=A0A2G2YU14_CAPAN|nr:putative WD repeat-containing protein 43-like [Capsicum annuum]PHT73236.1 hypothetical protein T459_24021 [Capsicum annuum]
MTDLEVQIKEVANIVEHTIQLRVTEVLENDENPREKAQERLSDSLQQVAEDIDCIWKELTKIQDKGKQASRESTVQEIPSSSKDIQASRESTVQEFPSSSKDILNVENNMVGRDDQRKWLVEHLTRSYSSEPKVIVTVGMGGIGKTTLANEVYNDVCIRSHFDVCAWATVSQLLNVKEISLSLLRFTKGGTFDMNDEAELANMLQKSLKAKRYLIVLDDMWKSEAWDAVRLCFPSENKGIRILLMTRNTEVVRDASTKNLSLQQIAEKCHGLPLTIVVVSRLLKFQRAIENWKSVAKDVKSFVTNDLDEQSSCVLGLSKNHLTSDLKAYLLHFRIFKEDAEIPVKKLMRSWMAEGFLNFKNNLEGEAEKCLLLFQQYIRNVKNLGINGFETDYESFREFGLFNNLVHLHQLKTLSLTGTNIWRSRILPVSIPSAKYFPATLKKLKLKNTYLSWSYLDIIDKLPNLEVLKLMVDACWGEEWHPIFKGFTRLKLLLIEGNLLKYWKATNDNFPILE